MSSKPTYLQKRGRRWWFRYAIPRALQPILGKPEFLKALDTCDLATAKQRMTFELMKAQAFLRDAQRKLELEASNMTVTLPADPEFAKEWTKSMRWLLRNQTSPLPQARIAEPLRKLTELKKELGEDCVRREVEKWFEGHSHITLTGELIKVAAPTKKGPPTFAEVLKSFRKHQKSGRSPKTIAQEAVQDALFLKLISPKARIDTIERSHCRRVREIIKTLPANWTRLGIDPSKVLELSSVPGLPMSPKTQNSYLSPFAAIFRYAVTEDWIEKSPAEGLHVQSDGIRARDRRLPFSDDDLQRIFDPNHFPFSDKPSAYWVPLLGAYSGCCLGELCQLRACDVREVEGTQISMTSTAASVSRRLERRV